MYLPAPASPRHGLSLLEVLAALTIFLLSFVAIGRLVTLASDRALDIQNRSEAAHRARSKMAEVVVGAVTLEPQAGTFEEDAAWTWEMECEEGTVPGIWNVRVRVSRTSSGGYESSSTLTQMVLDPSMKGSAFDSRTISGEDAATTDQGGTNPSGSGGTTPAGGGTTPAGGGAAPGGGGTAPGGGGGNPGGGRTTPGGR
jgi:hypothetical protein